MEPHVALLPSAGMGHLMPFLSLAAMLASRNCKFEAIIRSVHLLPPLLSSLSPPISALFLDIDAATCVDQLADDPSLSISYYILQNLFTTQLISNARAISKVKGVVFNTFHWFEAETIEALNNGKTMINHPHILPLGPFKSYESIGDHTSLPDWLDEQPAKSIVYVSFGSRTAMSKDQIKELGEGLLKSKQKFFWVLKSVKVDKVEETGLAELLGSSLLERIKEKRQGMVVKEWVKQEEILAHPAIGGFFSHCSMEFCDGSSSERSAYAGMDTKAISSNIFQK
ncbi:hypothetical protein K7X08_019313 [Anisodus acutangulus]|uniref:Uncharacterized protein n=1 Tax=Anisodus acutangulus TaxID=402998 RepID=A0A9Q1RPP4_9SOLA|nr:hypothetical protein K7X08_019313 [Anisodus acutangulus]